MVVVPRALVIGILVSALAVSSCSSDDNSPESVKTSTSTTTASAPSTQPFFGVGELNTDWSTGLGTGSGIASPIGEWTYEVEGGVAGSTSATGTVTTKSGDQLFVKITTTIIPDVPPPNARNRFVMEITGGTGQYANASGESEGEVQEQKVEGSLVESTLWWRGTITY